jgi:hypothetical protein
MNHPEPWYAPSNKKKPSASSVTVLQTEEAPKALRLVASALMQLMRLRWMFVSGIIFTGFMSAGFFLIQHGLPTGLAILAGLCGFFLSLIVTLIFWGGELKSHLPLHTTDTALAVAFAWLQGKLKIDQARRGPPAPELALSQFVSQVRAYATEKSFLNAKPSFEKMSGDHAAQQEGAPLLKRRWNEVVDSLDEFEIYLANDPQGMISKLVSKNPPKPLDAAVVFREVADTFDTTWRRKGINIEAAIVTPLKATAQEGLLRRLLVGPWRASAYFARRGASVVFSAKSVDGRVVARWEVDGLSIPDDFLAVAQNSTLTVNERIEKGLLALSPDPAHSPNTLYALISLVTWIDLAQACETDFSFKNNNNGFVIEIRLK